MIPTVIVLPVRDRLDLTHSIITQLQYQAGWDRLQVWDNGSGHPTVRYLDKIADVDERVTIHLGHHLGIYDMWRNGFDLARSEHPGAVNVLFLNNDVTLGNEVVQLLSAGLRSRSNLTAVYPDYHHEIGECLPDLPIPRLVDTYGSYRHGGLVGWCFMVAADRVDWEPLVDPQFEWWCGEDDIVFQAEAHGHAVARAECVGAAHIGGATAASHDWTEPAAGRDMARCLTKWGR